MTDEERELRERDVIGSAVLFLKEARMRREGVLVEGGRAVYIGPDADEAQRRNTVEEKYVV